MVCVLCSYVCNVWTDEGDSVYAAVELVVIKVSAVTCEMVGVCVSQRVKPRVISAVLLMSTMSVTLETALVCTCVLKLESMWCVR